MIPQRICVWCTPSHSLGPAPEGVRGDTHTMCEAARERLEAEIRELERPVAPPMYDQDG